MARPREVLKSGQGEDGNHNVPYVAQHPTNYIWLKNIEQLTDRLVSMDPFYKRIWMNTYWDHPPKLHKDTRSVNVWGFGGRGGSCRWRRVR